MRSLSILCVMLLLCGFAAAQATMIAGTASNWAPAYGVYAAPYVPLVTTPSVTLSTVSPSAVGASNATYGLVAGATNATLSSEFIGDPPVGVFSQPVWYGPSAAPEFGPEMRHEHRHGAKEQAFDYIAEPYSGMGAARLMAAKGSIRKATRTITNQDIDRVNQSNGVVKYDGKTEHL